MTRDEAKYCVDKLLPKHHTLAERGVAVDMLLLLKEFEICNNCKFDYCGCSVQDSILQVDPEATFDTFGCHSFKPSKEVYND